jgi:hypothetical protein
MPVRNLKFCVKVICIQSICIKNYSNSLQEKKNQKRSRLLYWFLALSSKALKHNLTCPDKSGHPLQKRGKAEFELLHGRSSDLLPFLNAFPKFSGKRFIQNDFLINCQLSIVNCQFKMKLTAAGLLPIFTAFPFNHLPQTGMSEPM